MENVLSKFHQWFKIPYKLHSSSIGDGPIVILLHGIATSSASWTNLTPYLKNNFRCITIDLLGFGQSPKPDWYSYTPDEHIKNINHTIKKMKIRESFILVGHSMGSLLTLHYASKYPKNVKQLFILSPPIYITKADTQKARKIWRDTLYAKAYKYIRTHKKFTLNGARGLKILALKNNPFSLTEETWLAFSKSLEECIEKQNVVEELEQIHCPVVIYYGTLDQLLIKSNIRSISSSPNVEIRPIKSGHIISNKYASLVAERLLEMNS